MSYKIAGVDWNSDGDMTTKNLTPLELWYLLRDYLDKYTTLHLKEKTHIESVDGYSLSIIENALKNYQELLEKPYVLVVGTHEHAQALIDKMNNYKDIKIANLEDGNKLKVLEIIKNKNVNVRAFRKVLLMKQNDDVKLRAYNSQNHSEEDDLIKYEYELLKEVLL